MRSEFDRRVLPDSVLDLIRAFQRRAPAHLAEGAALSAAYLSHRLSADVDLFCHSAEDVRVLVRALPEISAETGVKLEVIRDAGTHVRARAHVAGCELEADLVYDSTGDLAPPPPVLEGVTVESLPDLRGAKLTCILSRSEPRDLVDLLFLERAGYRPEQDVGLALQKDTGLDPGILAWLLKEFPVSPLPTMLEPITEDELRAYRDDLRERFRRLAVAEPNQK